MQISSIPEVVISQSKILVCSDEWLIGIPFTPEAMFWWGSFSDWCTAQSSKVFDDYTERGLLIVFRRLSDGTRWMLHASTGEFRNRDNKRASWRGFLMRHPELSAQLISNLPITKDLSVNQAPLKDNLQGR